MIPLGIILSALLILIPIAVILGTCLQAKRADELMETQAAEHRDHHR